MKVAGVIEPETDWQALVPQACDQTHEIIGAVGDLQAPPI
jgi:hypothetical protein